MTPEQLNMILTIANTDKLDDTLINSGQAIKIFKILHIIPFGLCDLMESNNYQYPLNKCIEHFTNLTYEIPKKIDNHQPANNPYTALARSVVIHNIMTSTDDNRIQREINAVNKLQQGDIDGSFKSLGYFQDR